MHIVSFMLTETGTYNDIYSRPYVTKMDSHVVNTISNKLESGLSISPNMFSGVASAFLAPSTITGNVIQIPNGWGERRLAFLLIIEHNNNLGGKYITCVQGYSDYVGVSYNGSLDPDMRFHINTITTVSRNTISTPNGVREIDNLIDTSQIINGVLQSDIGYGTNNMLYGLRPSDILFTNQANGTHHSSGGDIEDSRICLGRGLDIKKSKRTNTVPSIYLSDMTKAYNQALDMENMIGGRAIGDVFSFAADSLKNNEVGLNNNFIDHLRQLNGGVSTTSFTTNDLEFLDPNVSNATQIIRIGKVTKSVLHTAGQTESWSGSNPETVAATILANAIPGFMMASRISKLYFKSTNQDITNNINTIFIDVKSILNIDVTKSLDAFKARLEQEVLFDLTQGGIIPYTLEMECSVIGESKILISMFGGPTIPYTTLSAADNLYAPTFTNSKDNVIQVSHDMNSIFNAVDHYMSDNDNYSTFAGHQFAM